MQKLRQMVRAGSPEESQSLDVNSMIEEIRSLLAADARVHEVELRIELAPRLPAVQAHGVQLQQVVLNLARNAFEALADCAPGARHVGISSCCVDRGVEICVTDNGPGI